MGRTLLFFGGLVCVLSGGVWAAETVSLAELAKPGRVLMLRHAKVPGIAAPRSAAMIRGASGQRLYNRA